jgi:hypothetical protein
MHPFSLKSIISISIIHLLALTTLSAKSQVLNNDIHEHGILNATNSDNELWSTFSNQASLAQLQKQEIGLYLHNKFSISDISSIHLATGMPTKYGVFGFSLFRFGYSKFNHNTVSIAYAMKLSDKTYSGIQLSYFSTRVGDLPKQDPKILIEGGLLVRLGTQVYVGSHLSNLKIGTNRNKIDGPPTTYKLGIAYLYSQYLTVDLGISKTISTKPSMGLSANYFVKNKIVFRIGINSNPLKIIYGWGINWKNLHLDIAFSQHTTLGLSSQLSISYGF